MNKKIGIKIIASSAIIAFLAMQCPSVFAYSKGETVYSKTNATGEGYQTIVSAHLKNTGAENELIDRSILSNIKNVNGDETFTQDGEKMVWKSNGEDIYYQGDTDKELPIDMKITYKLDGKDIKPNEIIGKSGKIEVNLEFNNKEEHIVNINGTDVKMYTPFTIMSGLILENDKVKKVEVKNGKVIDNGQKSIVIGLCMPGMQESLGFDEEDINIPSNIKIAFETENFELGNIITYASPEIIKDADISKIDKLDELFEQMDELKASSEKLVDGTSKLDDGVSTLNTSVDNLKSGAGQLSDGANKAYNGAEEIADNMNKISSGTDSLVSGQKEVTGGLQEIQAQLPSDDEINTKQNNLDKLSGTNAQTVGSLENANKQIEDQLTSLETQLSSVNTQIEELEKLIETTGDESLKGTLKALESTKTALVTMQASLKEQKMANAQLIALLQANNQALDESSEELKDMNKLRSGIAQLYNGSKILESGAKSLQSGSKELSKGTSVLASSMNELKNGANELNNGTHLLKDGTNDLQKGSGTLKDGMISFNEQGIEKLYNAVNGDLKGLKQRIEKLQDLANDYISFSGSDENAENEVKFVIITDELKSNEAITNNGVNLQNQTTNKNEKNTEGK